MARTKIKHLASAQLHAHNIAKYHIFPTSVGNGSLDFEGFRLSRLKSKLTILRTIASTNNNLEQFTETWPAVL